MSVIGQRIRLFREEARLSQVELAQRANISREAVGNYENGRRVPPVNIAQKIADVLGMTVNDLLYPEGLQAEAPVNILGLDTEALARQLEKRSEVISDIVRSIDQMNDVGREKAREMVADLATVPKYQR